MDEFFPKLLLLLWMLAVLYTLAALVFKLPPYKTRLRALFIGVPSMAGSLFFIGVVLVSLGIGGETKSTVAVHQIPEAVPVSEEPEKLNTSATSEIKTADNVQNKPVTYHLKPIGDGKIVFVWRNKEMHDEAMGIIASGLNDTKVKLLNTMVACRAKEGTPVTVTDVGLITHDILVIDGPNAGCRGNIPAEELARDE